MSSPPTPTTYRPSPLSFNGTSRASPFRRPNSPLAPAPSTSRTNSVTPSTSPLKQSTPSSVSPEKLGPQSPLRNAARPVNTSNPPSWMSARAAILSSDNNASLPTRGNTATSPLASKSHTTNYTPTTTVTNTPKPTSVAEQHRRIAKPTAGIPPSNDTMSQIPPALLHSLRESFAVLDHSNSGFVTAANVADTLAQLGLDSSPSSMAAYFPQSSTSSSSNISLATYLNTLSSILAELSPAQELLAAFEAFDADDSGQIDAEELRDALLHTAPDPGEERLTVRDVETVMTGFVGRRAFGKRTGGGVSAGKARGDVFRYQEFVAGLTGAGTSGSEGADSGKVGA